MSIHTLRCINNLLIIEQPIIMGIINCTPDSFYSQSRHKSIDDIVKTAEQMLENGATILDIGGQSTRPGSDRISIEEELRRVIVPIERIKNRLPDAIISIDTYQSRVVAEAIDVGAAMVNDVTAGSVDADLIKTVAQKKAPYVLMHMQGSLENMQQNPVYENLMLEMVDFFSFKIAYLREQGIVDIIIDPGIGFGKAIEHNFEIIRHLGRLKMLGVPIMVGLSRKSFIYKSLATTPDNSLNGTTALHAAALMNGANILRVHDVKEAAEVVKLISRVV